MWTWPRLTAVAGALKDWAAAVAIMGFGTFTGKSRPAREGRNPRTGERIAIGASNSVSFKAGKALREAVN